MLKRWCSIKEIEVYLLCEILTSKDTLQGQKKLLRASLNQHHSSLIYLSHSFSDFDPCTNASCKYYGYCQALSPQTFACVCESSCPSYEELVCASNGRTFRNMCLLKKEICETSGNYTHYHP